VRSKLTKGLRWAVANAIPVLTPQLFVAETRMCDEDTDLGLEYTLSRMLSPAAEQERARRRATQPPPAVAPVAPASTPVAGRREPPPSGAREDAPAPNAAPSATGRAAREVGSAPQEALGAEEEGSEPAADPGEATAEEEQP
jgi:hypothetical protein